MSLYVPPWETLMIVNAYMRDGLSLGQDRQEQLDAAWECRHGRLPHDATPACGCWPQERPALTVIAGSGEQLEFDEVAA